MKFNSFMKSVFLICTAFFIPGCAANLSPMEVSDKFWTAVKNGNGQVASGYVTSGSLESLKNQDLEQDILPINNVSFGKTVIDGEQAWVDTDVEIAGNDPFTLPLKTVLLMENRQWKIDYDKTVASVSKTSSVARVLGELNIIGEQFNEKLNQSLDEIERTLPQVQKEIEKIEDNMREKLPELKQRLEEFMRQLEEALGGSKKETQPSPRAKEI